MKVGCCAPIKYINKIKTLGFDFIECPSMEMPSVNNGFVTHINKFIPAGKSIYSNDDFELIIDFISYIIKSAKTLNIKSITFGSGASRRITNFIIDNFEKSKWEQLLLYMDKIASKQSILILLEPLTKLETNFINTIPEAVEWIDRLNLKSFGVTIDSYHYFKEHTSLDESYINQKYIKHAHFADFNQSAPKILDNKLSEYLKFVKNVGCDLSIEMVPFDLHNLSHDLLTKIRKS